MLIVHPDSNCDICLEQFSTDSQSKAPHVTRCGHVFCLRCLQSLNRRVCPMCRDPFQPADVTRIHIDQRSFSTTGCSPPHSPSIAPLDTTFKYARELHDRINDFVFTGASTTVAHELTKDCRTFFEENDPSLHLDLHVTYQLLNHFLLGYYRAFFQDPAAADKLLYQFQAEVQAYHQSWEDRYRRLTKKIEDLTEKLRLEVIAKENEMQGRQSSEAIVQSLKDELQAQESWWNWKYEVLRRKHSDLQEEFSKFRESQQVTVAQCPTPPDFLDEKADEAEENDSSESVIQVLEKDWNDSKHFPQPPTYDYATSIEGCLSIISTPLVDERTLRDEDEIKELLSDLLTDPTPAHRQVFNSVTKETTNSTLSSRISSSSKHKSSKKESSNRRNLPNSFSISTSIVTTTLSTSNLKACYVPPFVATPDVPLWTRKRSAPAVSHNQDSKGKAISMVRTLSASETE